MLCCQVSLDIGCSQGLAKSTLWHLNSDQGLRQDGDDVGDTVAESKVTYSIRTQSHVNNMFVIDVMRGTPWPSPRLPAENQDAVLGEWVSGVWLLH